MELSEAIEKSRVDNVFLCEGPRHPQKGSLALIGHHLIFSPSAHQHREKKNHASRKVANSTIMPAAKDKNGKAVVETDLWLLHRAIDRVLVEPFSRDPTSPRQGAYLRLKCKNFMICCFEINDLDDCQAVARSIEKLSNLNGFEHDYPFYYRCPFKALDNGWEAFGVEEHFSRLQLLSGERWRISGVNANHEVCPTYPEAVIVPRGIGDDYLRISATYRDGGRFPVLAYYHGATNSSLVRCGQPLVGPTGRRCREDETIVNALLSATSTSKGLIYDTRGKALAMAAKGKGGGTESPIYYSHWRYVNGSLPRLRELRDSLARLVEVCNENSPEKFLSRLASSQWLQHIADTLTAGATVAQCLHYCKEVPVLVHGSEGTDATLLVTSLAQLCLDVDARTIRGFEALVEREWVQAGHPFSLRCAHSAYATGAVTGPHEAPVFLCLLDCVWQLTQQYPCSFEFGEELLIFLFEHAYASEFGTFLGNSEAEKQRWNVKSTTVSLWSHINHPEVLKTFVNPLYEPYDGVLWPSVAPQSIILWERMYLRWQQDWSERDEVQRTLGQWKVRERALQSKLLRQDSREQSVKTSPEDSGQDQTGARPLNTRHSGQARTLPQRHDVDDGFRVIDGSTFSKA